MALLQTLGSGRTQLQQVPNNGLCLAFPLTPGPTADSAFDMMATTATIELWFFVNSFTNPGAGYTGSDANQTLVLGRGSAGYSFFLSTLKATPETGTISFYSYASGEHFTSTVTHPVGQWVHLRVDYNLNGANGPLIRFWQNNQLTYTASLFAPVRNTTNFSLGHVDSNRNGNAMFGLMDELRWWRTVRTDAQNTTSWRKRNVDLTDITPTSMACCYSFEDQNRGTIADYQDSSGNGLFLRDSNNSGAGAQRGSTAPLLGAGGAATGKILTV